MIQGLNSASACSSNAYLLKTKLFQSSGREVCLQFVCLPCHLFSNTIMEAKKQLLLLQRWLMNLSKLWKITRGKNFIPLKAKLLHRNYIIT